MSVRIRLQRQGRTKRPYYHIVIADQRSPRDGRYIERIGSYNPMTIPATIDLDNDKAFDWLMKGATPTDTARAILKYKGILYRKHLARGVQKGALSQEKADEMYEAFIAEKEAKVQARKEQSVKEREAFLEAVSGKAAPLKQEVKEESDETPTKVTSEPEASEEAKTSVETATGEEKSEAATKAAEETAEETTKEETTKEETAKEESASDPQPEGKKKEEKEEKKKEDQPATEAGARGASEEE